MELSVLKFGGTSAAKPEQMAQIFQSDIERNRVAVLSAVGKDIDNPDDKIKGTNLLYNLEEAVEHEDRVAIQEAQEAFIEKNRQAYHMLGERALTSVTNAAYVLMSPERAKDGYAWIGEHVSARLFAQLVGAVYVPTGLRFVDGQMDIHKSIRTINQTIPHILKSGAQVVTEGFYGLDNASGTVNTLPRGGSDTTAVVITGAHKKATSEARITDN